MENFSLLIKCNLVTKSNSILYSSPINSGFCRGSIYNNWSVNKTNRRKINPRRASVYHLFLILKGSSLNHSTAFPLFDRSFPHS